MNQAQRDELFKKRIELGQLLALERAKARVASRKAQADHDLAEIAAHAESVRKRIEAEEAADRASSAAYCQAVIELAKGGLDRVRGAAEFVQKAAAAVFALYTGALTVSFSVTDEPLPSRGILPSVFLGFAIVLATAYLAFLTRGQVVAHPKPADGRAQAELNRAAAYVHWVNESRLARAWMLQSSVIALAIGVLVLPAPFLRLPQLASTSATVPASCPAPLVADDLGTGACVPPWPDSPLGGDPELRKLRYASQLAEVSSARQEARAKALASQPDGGEEPGDAGALLCVMVVGLALVLMPALVALAPRVLRRGRIPSGAGTIETLFPKT